jgi:hypothetical protein
VIHRTFRSLDEAPKLVGFTVRQWAALIAGASAVLALVYLAHLPTKPAITLCVFVVGLPAALTYVSESGGLQLGGLLRDMCRWRFGRKAHSVVPPGFAGARGLVVLARPDDDQALGGLAHERQADSYSLVAGATLEDLLSGERWER